MAIPTAYLTTTKNLTGILEQIQKGGVPPKFTYAHLKQLGFPSSADRPVIPVLKALGFLDEAGVPQERYRRFKDASNAKSVMAEGIREAYADVFAIDENANALGLDKLRGIFARLSGKGSSVTDKMAATFRALADQADFAAPSAPTEEVIAEEVEQEAPKTKEHAAVSVDLHHDVHLHLPASTEIEVYDAIFRSLRENLLSR